jgi:hypothetical protein
LISSADTVADFPASIVSFCAFVIVRASPARRESATHTCGAGGSGTIARIDLNVLKCWSDRNGISEQLP